MTQAQNSSSSYAQGYHDFFCTIDRSMVDRRTLDKAAWERGLNAAMNDMREILRERLRLPKED
jgi:hypothetical protein